MRTTSPDGLDPVEQLRAIRDRVDELVARAGRGVHQGDRARARRRRHRASPTGTTSTTTTARTSTTMFDERIFPVLTPLAVDPAHPFPYISNLSLNLAVVVRDPATGERALRAGQGAAAAPPLRRAARRRALRAARAGDRRAPRRAVPRHGGRSRTTRSASPATPTSSSRTRPRTCSRRSRSVLRRRTQVRRASCGSRSTRRMTDEVLELLCRELELDAEPTSTSIDGPLDLAGLWALYALDRPELKDEPWAPQTPAALAGGDPPPDFFRLLRSGDVLVHHPYDSFATSVEAFVDAGGARPAACSRSSRRSTAPPAPRAGIVALAGQGRRAGQAGGRAGRAEGALRRAGEHRTGPRARGGGRARRVRARRAEDARQDRCSSCARRPTASGATATSAPATTTRRPPTLYEDIGLLTADPDLGADLTDLFNHLTGYSRPGRLPQAARRAGRRCARRCCELIRARGGQGPERPHRR